MHISCVERNSREDLSVWSSIFDITHTTHSHDDGKPAERENACMHAYRKSQIDHLLPRCLLRTVNLATGQPESYLYSGGQQQDNQNHISIQEGSVSTNLFKELFWHKLVFLERVKDDIFFGSVWRFDWSASIGAVAYPAWIVGGSSKIGSYFIYHFGVRLQVE
jgi:hypothetical protein